MALHLTFEITISIWVGGSKPLLGATGPTPCGGAAHHSL